MANERYFINQPWTLTIDTEEDQSSATARNIKAIGPDKSTKTFTALLNGSDNNKIYYKFTTSDLTVAGDWVFYPETTIAGDTNSGKSTKIHIYEPGKDYRS